MQKIHALHKHITYNSRAAGGLDQKVALYKKFVELEWFFWGGGQSYAHRGSLSQTSGLAHFVSEG